MKNLRNALLIVAVVVMFPMNALANELARGYSDNELMQILTSDGYTAVSQIEDGMIRIKIDGRSYILFNKPDGDLQLYYAITGVDISYVDVNEWNKTKRLSKAYLDNDNDPVLEADLLANGGISHKHVTEFFDIFLLSVSSFREFIIENDAS